MCDQILKPNLRRTVCLSGRRTGISNLELQGLNGRYLAWNEWRPWRKFNLKFHRKDFLLIACSYRVESLKVVCWKSRWYFPLSYFLVWFDFFPQFYGKPLPFTSHVQSGSWCFRVFRQQGKIKMGKKGAEHYIIARCNFIVSVLFGTDPPWIGCCSIASYQPSILINLWSYREKSSPPFIPLVSFAAVFWDVT